MTWTMTSLAVTPPLEVSAIIFLITCNSPGAQPAARDTQPLPAAWGVLEPPGRAAGEGRAPARAAPRPEPQSGFPTPPT